MLKLQLPFRLNVKAPRAFLRAGLPESRRKNPAEIILEGLSISIKAGARIYQVSSDRSQGVGAGPSSGTAWTRWLWQLGEGFSIEQQMAIPADGDALAISWRSIGRPLFPCRFEVRPIFSAPEPFAATGFRFEPETNGGRLTWRPLENSSKIIADTNGRFDPIGSPSGAGDYSGRVRIHPRLAAGRSHLLERVFAAGRNGPFGRGISCSFVRRPRRGDRTRPSEQPGCGLTNKSLCLRYLIQS